MKVTNIFTSITLLFFFINLNSVYSQTSSITASSTTSTSTTTTYTTTTTTTTTTTPTTTTTTTTNTNTSPPSIQSVTIGTGNQINLKWAPNRVTTTNTRYKINVINKNNINLSFEYPGN